MEFNFKVMIGDCIDSMKSIADKSVQCCVTSPPYFGLRDYGVAGQIGLEETPEQYIEKLVNVFREVRRVLADDGTLWVNIGDSYSNNPSGGNGYMDGRRNRDERRASGIVKNLKQKDLIGIPWMLAFALRADGWYLRQDIIWNKSNPMPESVKDRCTRSHEYIFLLSKSQKYYWDIDSIRVPCVSKTKSVPWTDRDYGGVGGIGERNGDGSNKRGASRQACGNHQKGKNRRSVWSVSTKPYLGAHFATFPPDLIEPCILAGSRVNDIVLDPFGGSGTTAGVACGHDRAAIICELNPKYAKLVDGRVASIYHDIQEKKIKESQLELI